MFGQSVKSFYRSQLVKVHTYCVWDYDKKKEGKMIK